VSVTTPIPGSLEAVRRLVPDHRPLACQDRLAYGRLLQRPIERVLEPVLEGEITDHLGYDEHDLVGKDGGNSRDGRRP
jgi:putative transposase